MYSNGANTDYPAVRRPFSECYGGSGVYCDGAAGVDLQQAFMTLASAKQIAGGLSAGVGVVVERQQLRAKGLALFAGRPSSADPSWGLAVRGGFEWGFSRASV